MFVVTISFSRASRSTTRCHQQGRVKPSSGRAGAKGCISAAALCCVAGHVSWPTLCPFPAHATSVSVWLAGSEIAVVMLEIICSHLC